MTNLRVSPELAELLAVPENRAVFERERSINRYVVGIEETMASQGISKTLLAKKAQKRVQSVSRALQGRQNLTIGTMVDLAVSLGKTVDVQVVDLDPIVVATESTASGLQRAQQFVWEYLNQMPPLRPYQSAPEVVAAVSCGVD